MAADAHPSETVRGQNIGRDCPSCELTRGFGGASKMQQRKMLNHETGKDTNGTCCRGWAGCCIDDKPQRGRGDLSHPPPQPLLILCVTTVHGPTQKVSTGTMLLLKPQIAGSTSFSRVPGQGATQSSLLSLSLLSCQSAITPWSSVISPTDFGPTPRKDQDVTKEGTVPWKGTECCCGTLLLRFNVSSPELVHMLHANHP